MKSASIKYSILVPVYNGAKYLPTAVETIVSQNADHYELIISDDGSLDNTIEICVLEQQQHMDRVALLEQKKYGCTYIQPMRVDASEDFCAYAAELGLCASMFYSNTLEDNKKYRRKAC